MKHIILSRVNIPRNLDPSNHVRPAPWTNHDWNEKRVELLNKFCRASLRNQTNQNFHFISLWGNHWKELIDPTEFLENETALIITREWNELDSKAFDFEAWRNSEVMGKLTMDFANQIRHKVRHFLRDEEGPFLFTNLDCDDALRDDYVSIVQKKAPKYIEKAPVLIDANTRYTLNPDTGAQGYKTRTTTPSPFSTSLEVDSIEVYPLKYHHSMMLQIDDKLSMVKINRLKGLQTVTDTNILSQGLGDRDFRGFNIKEFIGYEQRV